MPNAHQELQNGRLTVESLSIIFLQRASGNLDSMLHDSLEGSGKEPGFLTKVDDVSKYKRTTLKPK